MNVGLRAYCKSINVRFGVARYSGLSKQKPTVILIYSLINVPLFILLDFNVADKNTTAI